ncbi:MAG: DUF874 domain-containing protein [Gemmobacter sp.]
MGPVQSLDELISMIRRRWFLLGLVTIAGTLATLWHVLGMARSYETAAVIQIEQPLVAGGGAPQLPGTSARRLQQIEQRLFVRENMLAMIDRHDLFRDLTALTETEKVVLLRQSLRLEGVTSGSVPFGADQPVSALVIWATLDDPHKAAAVANDLAAAVLETSAATQAAQVRDTLAFYAEEEARIGAAMAAVEDELTAFKNANLDVLPAGLALRREELSRIETALREIETTRLPLVRELSVLEANTAPRSVELRQMATLRGQIESMNAQEARLRARLDEIEALIARAPAAETVLQGHERRLAQLQEQYLAVLQRRAEAETAQRLEANRQTERLTLLEPALPPDHPTRSGRRRVMAFGVFGSMIAALAVAFTLELRNPVIRSSRRLQRTVGLRPAIAIPLMDEATGPMRGRILAVLGLATLVLLATAAFSGW